MSEFSINRLLRNIGWQSVAMGARLLITVATLAVLTRISGPEVMGLYGISWVGVAVGFAIVQSGAAQSLIGLREMRPAHVAAARALALGVSCALALLLVFAAPLLARIYGTAEVADAYRLAAVFVVVMSLGAVDMALAQKDLEFRLIAKVQTLASIGAGVTAILLGYLLDPLVGLFAMQAMIGPFQFLVFRGLGRRFDTLRFGYGELGALWRVGMQLSLNSLTGVLMRNLPQVLIALFLPLNAVGMFTLARRIVEIIGTQIGGVVNQVIYPTFARLAGRPDAVAAAFLQTSRFTAMLMMLPLIFLGVDTEGFLALYAGDAWRDGSLILALLLLMQAGFAIPQNIFPTFQAIGHFSVVWKWNLGLTSLQAMMILVFPHTLPAAAVALAVSTLVVPLPGWLLSRVLGFPFMRWLRGVGLPVLSGIACAIAGHLVFGQIARGDSYGAELLRFGVAGIGTCSIYLLLLAGLDPSARKAIRRILERQ